MPARNVRRCIRWTVEAAFADGTRAMLRDFAREYEARAWASQMQGRSLYPGRPYRLEVCEREVAVEED